MEGFFVSRASVISLIFFAFLLISSGIFHRIFPQFRRDVSGFFLDSLATACYFSFTLLQFYPLLFIVSVTHYFFLSSRSEKERIYRWLYHLLTTTVFALIVSYLIGDKFRRG
ncbi:MAG: hypothetical protein V2G33_07355 [bacterium JZ-2024 1]